MVTAAAAECGEENPNASAPALAAVRHCRRVIVDCFVMGFPPRWSPSRLLVLLHPEFLDTRCHVVRGFLDDGAEFLRRGRYRNRTAILDHGAIVRRRDNRRDMIVQRFDDRLRRAGGGADAEPADAG